MFFNDHQNQQVLEISWQSIWKVVVVFLLVWSFWFFHQTILLVLVAFILASLLETPIDFLALRIKSRWLAVGIVYLSFLFLLGFFLYSAVPIILDAVIILIRNFNLNINPDIIVNILENFKSSTIPFQNILSTLAPFNTQLVKFFAESFGLLVQILGGTFAFFFVILLAFFLNIEQNGIERGIKLIIPKNYEQYAIHLWTRTRQKISGWFYSQLLLSLFVGLFVFISAKIINIPNAEFLAILAALLDFLPYIGPFIAGVVIVIFGLSQNLFSGALGVLIFIAIQMLENIIAPLIRSRAIKISPLMIIFAILFGEKLAGTLGAIIAIPLAAAIIEFIKDIRSGRINSYLPQKKLL